MKKKKKLLFLMGALNGGGAERVMIDTVNNLSKEKYDITVMLVRKEGIYIQSLAPHIKFKYITNPKHPLQFKIFNLLWRKFNLKFVYRFFIRGHYDYEIAFLEGLATSIISCSPRKTKKIAWIHTDMINNPWADVDFKNDIAHKSAYNNFNEIICVSGYVRCQFIKRFGHEEKTITLYNLVNDKEIRKKSELITLPKNPKITFVSVGRLTQQKGFDRLLSVHKKLIDDGLNHQIQIIGEGTQRQELEEYIKKNNLENSFHLLGFHENPYPYIKNADIFVCSSRAEGFSTVVTEALILGVPVISVDCSGASELLDNGKYGMLIPNEESSIYNAMKEMIINKNIRDNYARLSEERGDYFKLSNRINDIENLFDYNEE